MELIDAGPELPQSIGKYEVVRPLAVGGMAEVFLARTSGMLGFQKTVVIKRILPHLANRADFIQMFLDEARITTQLQHPNIVQTYEVGVANRSYFIAMEYLDGETVRSIMNAIVAQKARLPVEHAVQIVSAVASALHYAHERADADGRPLSIVHRDVTPQNIIVTFDGSVKLLDFGIAKAQNRMGETRAGTLKGKLPYMSPEQCSGEEMDQRSDLFSLGIMLYELTLTRRLFRGASDFQVLKQIVEGEITPPRALDPSYPAALEEIVLRALRKPRDERYQSARELLVDLDAFSRTERLPVSTVALGDYVRSLFSERKSEDEAAALRASLTPTEEDEPGFSVEIEVGSARPRVPLDGPDIPLTEPFKLEFTNASPPQAPSAPSAPSVAPVQPTLTPAPAPPRRSTALRAVGLCACVALGAGAAVWVRRASPPPAVAAAPPPVTPAPSVAAPPPAVAPAPPTPAIATPAIATPSPPAPVPAPVEHHRLVARPHPRAAASPAPPARLEGEGTLVLATTPWCDVTIDRLARGSTPLTVKLHAGTHTLLLRNDEFHVKRTVTLTVLPNQTLRKKLDFD